MNSTPPIIIYRHRKENLKKCSLQGLEKNESYFFYTYPKEPLPINIENPIVLDISAKTILSSADHVKGLILIDATWRYADKMMNTLPSSYERRSLPKGWQTAYPRKQTQCPNPKEGLASIEALYIALKIMKRDVSQLLNDYYWKKKFLMNNKLKFTEFDDIINYSII